MKNKTDWEKRYYETDFSPNDKIYGGEVMDRGLIKEFIAQELQSQKAEYVKRLEEMIDKTTGEDVTPKQEIEKMGVNQVYYVGGIHEGLQHVKYRLLPLLKGKTSFDEYIEEELKKSPELRDKLEKEESEEGKDGE
jgi:hypothetical protein